MPDPDARRRLGDVLRGVRARARPDRRAAPADPAPSRPASEPERGPDPALSVVVPVYNVAQYLPECLDSILGQSLRDLEVIAVDDGSTDGCPEILAAYAERDPRLRVLSQANAGQGVARNRAVEVARGEFLTFCDSDDTVPRKAYEIMVRTLRRSGSDFVVGAARRVKHDRARRVAWGETVHEFDRLGTTIDDFPAAMQDIIACNRLFRTDFWRSRVGGFRGGIAYEDHVPMLAAYVRADRFDVLARVTYNWRVREDHTSTGQQKALLQNLRDRVEVKEEAYALLRAEGSDVAYDAWVGRCLDIDFPPFLTHALAGSEDYRATLAAAYRTFLDRASPRALRTVRHDRLVRAWLCAGEHWEALATADAWLGRGRSHPVRIEGDRLYAVDDLPREVAELLPPEAWALAESETALRTALRSVHRDAALLRCRGFALVPGLETGPGTAAELDGWLVERDSGEVIPLAVTRASDPEAEIWADDTAARHLHAGFTAAVPLDRLAASAEATSWRLRLRLRQLGVVRESGVYEPAEGSGAVVLRREVVELGGRRMRVEPSWDPEGGFQVAIAPETAAVAELEPPDGPRARGRLVDAVGLRVVARATGDRFVPADVAEDGGFELALPDEGPWSLRVREPGQPLQRLLWTDPRDQIGEPRAGRFVWREGPDGVVNLVSDGRRLRLEHLELQDDAIIATISASGLAEEVLRAARWRGRHVAIAADEVEPLGEQTRLRFPTGPLPSGPYTLVVTTPDGVVLEAQATDAFAATIPWSQAGAEQRISLRLRGDRTVVAELTAPLDDEERAPAGQEQLRRTPRRSASMPSVLLSAGGDVADSVAALDAELAQTHPSLERVWAVRDRSVAVPQGARAVLIGSRAWYAALGSAPLVWTSGDLPDFFVPAPGQRTLQTFTGFPVAALGTTLWRARGLSERAVELELERRQQQWSAVIAPTEEVAELYRRDLELPEPVLVTGYPRTDPLVTGDRVAARARVLAHLGLSGDPTVVLHAPARRDRATRAALKGAAVELDLPRVAAGLGPGHVLLSYGVPHVEARAADPAPDRGSARIVDATTYPSLPDLLLAADVAVLDYSELRFDWALTGRLAVHHVPDRDAYLAAVRPPLDFDSTSPGAHVDDADGVVDAIRQRAVLEAAHAADVAALNARFNPLHDGQAAARLVAAVLGPAPAAG